MSLDFFSKTVSFLFCLHTFLGVVVVALGITAIKLRRVALLMELHLRAIRSDK